MVGSSEVRGGTPPLVSPRGLYQERTLSESRSEAPSGDIAFGLVYECDNRGMNIVFDCVRTECVAPRAAAYGACVGPNLRFLSLSYGITAGSLTRTLRGQP